jgi:hypothetical protein
MQGLPSDGETRTRTGDTTISGAGNHSRIAAKQRQMRPSAQCASSTRMFAKMHVVDRREDAADPRRQRVARVGQSRSGRLLVPPLGLASRLPARVGLEECLLDIARKRAKARAPKKPSAASSATSPPTLTRAHRGRATPTKTAPPINFLTQKQRMKERRPVVSFRSPPAPRRRRPLAASAELWEGHCGPQPHPDGAHDATSGDRQSTYVAPPMQRRAHLGLFEDWPGR